MLKSYISIECYKQHSIIVFIRMRKIYTYFIYLYIYTYYIASDDIILEKDFYYRRIHYSYYIPSVNNFLFLLLLEKRLLKRRLLLTCYLYIMYLISIF